MAPIALDTESELRYKNSANNKTTELVNYREEDG